MIASYTSAKNMINFTETRSSPKSKDRGHPKEDTSFPHSDYYTKTPLRKRKPPMKTKTPYENENPLWKERLPYDIENPVWKRRPPTKTKTSYENEDPVGNAGYVLNFLLVVS